MTDGYGDDDGFFFFGFDLTLRPHTYHGWIYSFFFRFIEWSKGTIVTGSTM